jgi:hypothetical protein
LPAFHGTERDDANAGKKRASMLMLPRPETPNRFLDIDRARVRRIARIAERQHPLARIRATAKEVDEDGRIEENRRQLSDATIVSAPLVVNPPGGIRVPIMTFVRDRAERRLEQLPAVIIVQRTLDCTGDVRAAAARAYPPVKFPRDVVAESYVQTHGHMLAHCP